MTTRTLTSGAAAVRDCGAMKIYLEQASIELAALFAASGAQVAPARAIVIHRCPQAMVARLPIDRGAQRRR